MHLDGSVINVFLSGRWGAIAYHAWTTANTRVVCRQLGFTVRSTRKSRPVHCVLYIYNCI